jgi:hypothetical protein
MYSKAVKENYRTSWIGWCAWLACCSLTGCLMDPDVDVSDDDWVDEQVDVAQQKFRGSRSDYKSTLTVHSGFWGDWTTPLYCNEGAWAIGYQMRVEPNQGTNRDDTALNTVRLQCVSRSDSGLEWILPHSGIWGTWGLATSCSGADNFLTSARMRVEPDQGSKRDDTAANDIHFGCYDGGYISAGNGGPWGDWTAWNYCPPGSAVCGLSIRVEPDQGSKRDDTAMNGMKLYCCNL